MQAARVLGLEAMCVIEVMSSGCGYVWGTHGRGEVQAYALPNGFRHSIGKRFEEEITPTDLQPVERVVLVTCYDWGRRLEPLRAHSLGPDKWRARYPLRLHWEWLAPLPSTNRPVLRAIAFSEGCWPVLIKAYDPLSPSGISYSARSNPIKATIRCVFYRRTMEFGIDVAYAAGIGIGYFHKLPLLLQDDWAQLVRVVDWSDLSHAERRMVFTQLQDLVQNALDHGSEEELVPRLRSVRRRLDKKISQLR